MPKDQITGVKSPATRYNFPDSIIPRDSILNCYLDGECFAHLGPLSDQTKKIIIRPVSLDWIPKKYSTIIKNVFLEGDLDLNSYRTDNESVSVDMNSIVFELQNENFIRKKIKAFIQKKDGLGTVMGRVKGSLVNSNKKCIDLDNYIHDFTRLKNIFHSVNYQDTLEKEQKRAPYFFIADKTSLDLYFY